MSRLKIQLALQGGGAKIVSLLAAAEAVQGLKEKIQITRVAGTSAGAIVACLMASGKPLGGVRTELQRIDKREWKRMLPAVSTLQLISRLLRNEPFWGSQSLRKFLGTFFDERGLRTLGDLKKASGIDVFIVAADVTNSKPHVYAKQDDFIVSSLLDSCALPFVLRTAKNSGGTVIVDGGICENLPAEELEAGIQEFGQVIGISFENSSPGKSPENAWEFGLSLLDTSINNSVLRARRKLGDRCVFGIQTKIGTFDFDKALSAGLEDSYDLVRMRAEDFFQDILTVSQGDKDLLVGDPWRHGNPESMAKLSAVYKAQHEEIKLEYVSNVLIVQANCLLNPGDPRYSQPDLIKHVLTFRPAGMPVYCHKFGLSSGTGVFLGRASWSVREKYGNERATIMLPILDPELPRKREVLLFFDPILRENDPNAPFTITFQDLVQGSMLDLKEERESTLGLTATRAAGESGRIDLVLLIPQSFPRPSMTASRLKDGSPGPQGRPMSQGDLANANIDVPPGFVPLGWTGTSPSALVRFGVDFRLSGDG